LKYVVVVIACREVVFVGLAVLWSTFRGVGIGILVLVMAFGAMICGENAGWLASKLVVVNVMVTHGEVFVFMVAHGGVFIVAKHEKAHDK
jgi:hypothetical protein